MHTPPMKPAWLLARHGVGMAFVKIVFADVKRQLVAMRSDGISDHHVELAVALHRGIDQSLDFIRFRHVGSKNDALPPALTMVATTFSPIAS